MAFPNVPLAPVRRAKSYYIARRLRNKPQIIGNNRIIFYKSKNIMSQQINFIRSENFASKWYHNSFWGSRQSDSSYSTIHCIRWRVSNMSAQSRTLEMYVCRLYARVRIWRYLQIRWLWQACRGIEARLRLMGLIGERSSTNVVSVTPKITELTWKRVYAHKSELVSRH